MALDGQRLAGNFAIFGPRATLARNRLVTVGGADEEPFGSRTVSVDERVLQFLMGGDTLDARLDGIGRWFDEPVDLQTLPVPDEVRNRLEMLPALRAFDRQLASRLRLEFLGPDPDLAVRTCASVASGSRSPASCSIVN